MERALARISRRRVVLVRYDGTASNYIGLIQLACVNADEELSESTDGALVPSDFRVLGEKRSEGELRVDSQLRIAQPVSGYQTLMKPKR